MSVEKPKTFDPNSNDHLEWALKLAYAHSVGDNDISQGDVTDALCDALCNLIGCDEFCNFCEKIDN